MAAGDDGTPDLHLAVRASRAYYVDQRSKIEIADELGISRFKVARLLETARDRGIVRIEIVEPDELAAALDERLRTKYRLRATVIVTTGTTPGATLAALGRATADMVADRLHPGDVLGLGWGTAVGEVVDALADVIRPDNVDVVQMAGGFSADDPAFNATTLALRAARALGGHALLLHAPAVLASPAAWRMLAKEPTIAKVIDAYDRVRVAVTGIGALRPAPASAIYRGAVLGDATTDRLAEAGVVGDAACRFITADGTPVPSFDQRTSGMNAEQVRNVDLRIGVAIGTPKLQAIHAALSSGLINTLATDSQTAQQLLTDEGSS